MDVRSDNFAAAFFVSFIVTTQSFSNEIN